jgi:hypothetical protein
MQSRLCADQDNEFERAELGLSAGQSNIVTDVAATIEQSEVLEVVGLMVMINGRKLRKPFRRRGWFSSCASFVTASEIY